MATVYVKRVPSSEWSRTVWDSATTYNLGDRVSYDDGSYHRYYECIQSNSNSAPQTDGDTYWVRIGSSPEFPYHAGDGRLDSYTTGDVYLETINARYTGSSYGVIWNHATELGSTPGEIILEDGEYFQPTSGLCLDGIDFTAVNTGRVTINHYATANLFMHYGSYITGHRSTVTGIHLVMGGNASLAGSGAKMFFDECKLTDQNSLYGPASRNDLVIGYSNHLAFKDTLVYFPNGTSQLFGYDTKQHLGQLPVWENSTFVINVGNGNNYNPVFYSGPLPYVKNCIFYIPSTNYNNRPTHSIGGVGESNVFYSLSSTTTFVGNSNFSVIDPQFVDPDKGNFQLRPTSPLIGGLKSENPLSDKYPEGLWVDHSHIPVQSSYSYTLDSGDGTNYTFSGDATGADPTLNANIRDTLTFTNSTGGHPLAIYNSQGLEVASESSGTTTFTPKYPDTYYYQCTVSGHENMRGNIVVSMGTLGTTSNPFSNYQHAIDAKAYTGSCDLLFKEGDHPMNGGGGPSGLTFESSYPNGIRFIGSSAKSTRLVTLDAINAWPMLYNSTSGNDTNGTISGSDFYFINIGIHLNNTTSYINRGILGVFRNLTLEGCIFSATATANIYGSLISLPVEWFNAKGCIFNISLGKGPGGDTWWFGGSYGITRYRIESSCFLNLSGYKRQTYENDAFFGSTADANSYFKNNIVYTDVPNCRYVLNSGSGLNSGYFTTNWTGNSFYNAAVTIGNAPNTLSGDNVVQDPFFIDLTTENEDFRLRPDSPLIGGIKKDPTNVYYLQPGNTYNGDGSQKDASAMSANGDPGPFNNFKEIIAAGVPYGSKIIIVNGTYSWPSEFHGFQRTATNWQDYTFEGYEYHAETKNKVIFDAAMQPKAFAYVPLGGTVGAGVYLDLHTSFNGIQFNRSKQPSGWPKSSTGIFSITDVAGKGSCTFNSCKFLGWICNLTWTGAGRYNPSSSMHWKNCEISIAFTQNGLSLLGGESLMASDTNDPNWSWENCSFYTPVGETTFYGVNAPNGTFFAAQTLFSQQPQTSRVFKNNILHFPGGSTKIGLTDSSRLPQTYNNVFNGFDIESQLENTFNTNNNYINLDPKFVDPANSNFSLRPNSVLVGKGL